MKILKGVFIAAMAVVVLFLILMVVGVNMRNSPTASPQQAGAAAQNKPTITKAEFDQITTGATYAEATAIIGGPGELTSELRTPGAPYTMAYTFAGEGSIGANAMLMWQEGKLVMKSQAGLK